MNNRINYFSSIAHDSTISAEECTVCKSDGMSYVLQESSRSAKILHSNVWNPFQKLAVLLVAISIKNINKICICFSGFFLVFIHPPWSLIGLPQTYLVLAMLGSFHPFGTGNSFYARLICCDLCLSFPTKDTIG